jgi:hypothetical protein
MNMFAQTGVPPTTVKDLSPLPPELELFARNDEVEAHWGIVDPILAASHEDSKSPLPQYPAGRRDRQRRTPCSTTDCDGD